MFSLILAVLVQGGGVVWQHFFDVGLFFVFDSAAAGLLVIMRHVVSEVMASAWSPQGPRKPWGQLFFMVH
jgi:hypothetical protein